MERSRAPFTSIGSYLFTRLHQLGVRSIFGVPGDYNLRLLDDVSPANLHWVGNCNELNAAYAADGYARINGLGVLVTTSGVGELSAINGIAGSYAEKVPILHIVGTPSRKLQDSGAPMHHTFLDGDYTRFPAIASHVTAAQVDLREFSTAAQKIDWIIKQALFNSRPVYLSVPEDMVDIEISSSGLAHEILVSTIDVSSKEKSIVDTVMKRVRSSRNPCILVDGEIRVINAEQEVDRLVRLTKWPTFTSPYGKGMVNEELSNVYGVCTGAFGDESTLKYLQTADLVLGIGLHISDTNTQSFSTVPDDNTLVSLSDPVIRIGEKQFSSVSPKRILSRLLHEIELSGVVNPKSTLKHPSKKSHPPHTSDKIDQKGFYHEINRLIRSGDLILTETGTSSHGGRQFVLPKGSKLFAAVTWLSIGYMLPAALGASLAVRDLDTNSSPTQFSGRTILFVGDGSLQMSVQEIGTMVKEKLNLVLIIINNNGYTIERAIHGRNQGYNDISTWRHQYIADIFGMSRQQGRSNYFSAETWSELQNHLTSPQIQSDSGITILEVFMDQQDCPGALTACMQSQIKEEKR